MELLKNDNDNVVADNQVMPNFDDLIKKAQQIAKEEGLCVPGQADLTDELLPEPGKVKRQSETLARVATRLAEETGLHPQNVPSTPNQTIPPESPQLGQDSGSPPPHAIPLSQPKNPPFTLDLDDIIQEQVDLLETWVRENTTKAKHDFIRFWAFKIPAIACSVSVAAVESLGFRSLVILLGVVSAFCVSIDALFPGGRLHNVHKRAASEARRLQHNIIGRWRQAQVGANSAKRQAVSAILDNVHKERERIDKYVTDAESSLGSTHSNS